MKLDTGLYYVGVNDEKVDLFEGQFVVPDGMAYNSYIVEGEKVAVMDSVSEGFDKEWLAKIKGVLGERKADYLVVQHMEPDHSANITAFKAAFPDAAIVSSAKAFAMMKEYFGTDYSDNRVVVGEGSELDLGGRTLKFFTAPMVHWPEVIVTYDKATKTLFSADGFGKFGTFEADPDDWACEARRYYFGIVGKYGAQVQMLLKKASGLEIARICPLHGPVLDKNLGYYLDLYNTWSSYGVESEGVTVAYTSVYGHTEKAVKELVKALEEGGAKKVAVSDLARSDMAEVVEDAFRYGKIVLATTTYNGDIFPYMRTFIDALLERNFSNRKIGFIENGSWAPVATKVMKGMLENCKNVTFCENNVKILCAPKAETQDQIVALAHEILS